MRRRIFLIGFWIVVLSSLADAQFNSGSTGADGALDLSTMNCSSPTGACYVQLPESGILNYTTVNIPPDKTLRFILNSRNTPVFMLAQGAVTINGAIDVSPTTWQVCPAQYPEELGPGGFRGGQPGMPGFGPGAGQSVNESGRWIGPLSLVPLVGGSGGAGSAFGNGRVGGNGGGAILVASSTSITGNGGRVNASGDAHVYDCSPPSFLSFGSGGAIRLVANTIVLSGTLQACSGNGNCGVIRLEASSLTFTGSSTPLAVSSPINPATVSSDSPLLTLISIGGFVVPSYSGRRFDLIDLLLPNQLPDPVNVLVGAQNIPIGTTVQIGFAGGSPNGTSTPCDLAGSFESSSCTATISNLTRTGGTYLLATAVFTPPGFLARFNPKGANHVVQIKLEAALAAKPKFVFFRSNGSVIDPKGLSPEFLKGLGM